MENVAELNYTIVRTLSDGRQVLMGANGIVGKLELATFGQGLYSSSGFGQQSMASLVGEVFGFSLTEGCTPSVRSRVWCEKSIDVAMRCAAEHAGCKDRNNQQVRPTEMTLFLPHEPTRLLKLPIRQRQNQIEGLGFSLALGNPGLVTN
jgi:hypothetical protein